MQSCLFVCLPKTDGKLAQRDLQSSAFDEPSVRMHFSMHCMIFVCPNSEALMVLGPIEPTNIQMITAAVILNAKRKNLSNDLLLNYRICKARMDRRHTIVLYTADVHPRC